MLEDVLNYVITSPPKPLCLLRYNLIRKQQTIDRQKDCRMLPITIEVQQKLFTFTYVTIDSRMKK